jgi:hypothetical protein
MPRTPDIMDAPLRTGTTKRSPLAQLPPLLVNVVLT